MCGVGRGIEGTRKVIHLFQTALKNLANKYFHFGQFLICPLWYSGLSYKRTDLSLIGDLLRVCV